MGGAIALTLRLSETEEFRGSCWTNILPRGLLSAPFYSPSQSLESSRAWLESLKSNREEDPALEEIWGYHRLCAPHDYGIIAVDYVTSSFLSLQGYTIPNRFISLGEPEDEEKWRELESLGVLTDIGWDGASPPEGWRRASLALPFKDVIVGDLNSMTYDVVEWVDSRLGLSAEEAEAWRSFIEERCDG